ncbi:MAG: 50S ribosomal protein L24 [Clostridia bacterium]|nr:50S ribosomal protein L24 [Clostridia bacterium]
MSLSLKKGDYVKIIAGVDKGKFGQIVGVDRENGRVAVEGANLTTTKKAVRPRRAQDKGGIVEIPRTVDISNVMAVCAACGKATRIGASVVDGKKVRVCKKCGAVLETKKGKEEKAKTTTVRKRKKTEKAETSSDEE